MTGDMRGLFVIVRGQYKHNKGRTFTNRVSGNSNYLGGYDPEDTTNEEWYMLYEREHAVCLSCGSDLERILNMVYVYILRYRHKERLFKEVLSPDHTRYPIDEALMHEVINTYGYYYEDLVTEQEDLAYSVIKQDTPLNRAKKRLRKRTHTSVEVVEKKVEVINTSVKTKKKVLNTKKEGQKKNKGLIPKKRKVSVVFE